MKSLDIFTDLIPPPLNKNIMNNMFYALISPNKHMTIANMCIVFWRIASRTRNFFRKQQGTNIKAYRLLKKSIYPKYTLCDCYRVLPMNAEDTRLTLRARSLWSDVYETVWWSGIKRSIIARCHAHWPPVAKFNESENVTSITSQY